MAVISPDRKTAVILFNLGGPDKLSSVRSFLFNLFHDKAIIPLPWPLRTVVAWLFSMRRAPVARKIYEEIGGKSPLLEQTIRQGEDLQAALSHHGEARVFTCMRYWHPMSREVVKQVKEYAPDHVILLPLYPHFSTTTTGSSLKDWSRSAEKQKLNVPTTAICCYPTESHLIAAHVDLLRKSYFKASESEKVRVLFSAHGLPKKTVSKGDPYPDHIEKTVDAIVAMAGMELDYRICYQSRVGPVEWIGPSTEEEIVKAGEDGVSLVVVPISFVSDHSETLVELDIEYKALAMQHKVLSYERVPALQFHSDYITSLKELCLSVSGGDKIMSSAREMQCPAECRQCPCLK